VVTVAVTASVRTAATTAAPASMECVTALPNTMVVTALSRCVLTRALAKAFATSWGYANATARSRVVTARREYVPVIAADTDTALVRTACATASAAGLAWPALCLSAIVRVTVNAEMAILPAFAMRAGQGTVANLCAVQTTAPATATVLTEPAYAIPGAVV